MSTMHLEFELDQTDELPKAIDRQGDRGEERG